MADRRPLLMIPGPIEIDPRVAEEAAGPPPGHLAPAFLEAFGRSLELMRTVWGAGPDAQPFVIAGSGTLAMESAATNLTDPGDRAVVVNTGYFSDRLATMLRVRGADVVEVRAAPGRVPPVEAVEGALAESGSELLFVTHVDTSTGVRTDAEALAAAAARHGALSVFDGVCATGAERFEMARIGADVYLTASQKAIGLPAGLALLVASPAALKRRRTRSSPPPMVLDWLEWLPIMRAYEERRPSYFSTPATNLVRALARSLADLAEEGMESVYGRHERAAAGMRAAWEALALEPVPESPASAAWTLSAVRYPAGVDASLVAAIASRGVVVAGGLHPEIRAEYFRVGHMGYATRTPEMLERTVLVIGEALRESGWDVEPQAALAALEAAI